VYGGTGADELEGGGTGTVALYGGPGNDALSNQGGGQAVLDGEGGNDTFGSFTDPGIRGPDVINGGPGRDEVSYGQLSHDAFSPPKYSVTVTLDGLPNDGTPGEHDNVLNNIESVTAAGPNDRLVGNSGANALTESGTGTVIGGGGNDRLSTLNGRVYGGSGNDHLYLDGNFFTNPLKTRAAAHGGPGDDTIGARNGTKDSVNCGSGKKDLATLDKKDLATACEKVKRPK
jgi:hypothetical protein